MANLNAKRSTILRKYSGHCDEANNKEDPVRVNSNTLQGPETAILTDEMAIHDAKLD